MEKNIETEYKLLVSREDFEKLLAFYPNAVFQRQINTYFDTLDYKIKSLRGAMRIRKKDGYVFTLKMPSKDGLLEYECRVKDNTLESLHIPEIIKLLHEYGIYEPFKIIAQLSTLRAVINTGKAELCFDISDYGKYRDYELEYEITAPHDGLAVFKDIIKKVGLHYEKNCDSKIKRALDVLCKE